MIGGRAGWDHSTEKTLACAAAARAAAARRATPHLSEWWIRGSHARALVVVAGGRRVVRGTRDGRVLLGRVADREARGERAAVVVAAQRLVQRVDPRRLLGRLELGDHHPEARKPVARDEQQHEELGEGDVRVPREGVAAVSGRGVLKPRVLVASRLLLHPCCPTAHNTGRLAAHRERSVSCCE